MSDRQTSPGGPDRISLQVRPIVLLNVCVSTCSFVRSDCFQKYVVTKVLKRLDSTKSRGGFKDPQKTFLVPISFGVSSTSLLHILDHLLQSRKSQGRHAGYRLHILFVDQSSVSGPTFPRETREKLMQRYPSHAYTTVSLEDCAAYRDQTERLPFEKNQSLHDFVSSLPSTTSRTDFIDITRCQLIIAFAKRHQCDRILFGDSTTRLAEKTLSETAKGRGVALPWLTADGDSLGLDCIFPLRDLLKKELVDYSKVLSPQLTPLLSDSPTQVSTSSKNVTIDGLMTQYFESVERNYPSVVTNVVRTSNKLRPSAIPEGSEPCSLCRCPIVKGTWGGDQEGTASPSIQPSDGIQNNQSLCYGCTRTVLQD